jgi:RNA polymerase sigma-70 factor (ECF subfamily)
MKFVERIGAREGIVSVETCFNRVSASDEFIPTRASLLGRLKDWGDQESWQEFFNTYWKLIYSVATKAGLSDAEAQDVVQETLLTVAKKVGQFKSDPALGSFKGWLLLITRRRIADQLEKRNRLPQTPRLSGAGGTPALLSGGADDSTRTSTVERVPDPAPFDLEVCWEAQWQENLLRTATEKVKSQVSPKQFQMFELYVWREWPVRKVAQTLGVNTGQVYLAKHRVTRLLKKEIQKLEALKS